MQNHDQSETSPYKINESFAELVWLKYPRICPLCELNHCNCPIKRTEINNYLPEIKENIYDKAERRGRRQIKGKYNIREIDGLVDMFDDIYRNSYILMDIEEICFHFTEEIGEVAEMVLELNKWDSDNLSDLSEKDKQKVKELQRHLKRELADVFSWSAALIIKFNIIIDEISSVIRDYVKVSISLEGRDESVYEIHPLTYSDILIKFWASIEDRNIAHLPNPKVLKT